MFTLLSACLARPPETLTVQVWAPWPGASVDEVESALGLPLEEGLAKFPGARDVLSESWAGLSRVTVTVPAASVPELLGHGLDRVVLPDEVGLPQTTVLAAESSVWLVPAPLPREIAGALERTFGPGRASSDTAAAPRVEVLLPAGSPIPADDLVLLRASAPGATVDALLDLALAEGSLRSRAALVRHAPPRSAARWNGAPVDVWTVGASVAEASGFWEAYRVPAIALPAAESLQIEVWGESDADAIEAEVRAAGAADVLVVSGRALPGGTPEPARLEVHAWWSGPIPDRAPTSGTRADDTVSVVRAGPEALASLAPPLRTTVEIEVDPALAALLHLPASRVAATIRDGMLGTVLVARDGTAIEIRVGDAAEVASITDLPIAGSDGHVVGDVATVTTVTEERVRVRYDGAPAALVRGPAPEGFEVVARLRRPRLGW